MVKYCKSLCLFCQTVLVLTLLLFLELSNCIQEETDTGLDDVKGIPNDANNSTNGTYPDEFNDDEYHSLEFDLFSFLRPGSEYCDEKSKCSPPLTFSWPDKNCYCDDLCGKFHDCCPGHEPSVDFIVPERDLFECRVNPHIERRLGVLIVTKCPLDWSFDEIRLFCEEDDDENNMLLQLPVSENNTEILFKNMYCAYCNERYEFKFWKPEVKCASKPTDQSNYSVSSLPPDCDLSFLPPSRDTALKYRNCPVEEYIKSCPTDFTDQTIRHACENGNTSYVFAAQKNYKNQACAACNNISSNDIYCATANEVFTASSVSRNTKPYSFRVLIDFNSGRGEIGKISEETGLSFSEMCLDNEIYDPFSDQCRAIFCISPRVPVRGKCEMNSMGYVVSNNNNLTLDLSVNCTLVKLEPSEFTLKNNSQLVVLSSGKVYNKSEYYRLDTGLFICHYQLSKCDPVCKTNNAFQTDIIEGYVTLILLVISLTALAFNFFIYVCFRQLRNTPGKILMCLILSLFLAQLFFLIAPHFEEDRLACMVSAIIIHFFYMAAFCWMNVIALDLWITFSNQFITAGSNEKSKRFIYFSLYAWLVPSVIVAFSVIIDNLNIDSDFKSFQPKYGDGACWMTSRNGVLLLFAGPLALFKIFDIVAFVNTARHIYKAKKHGAAARQNNNTCTFWINLKLSLVMGLTWVFAFVANFAKASVIWYLFIIFNTLQGVFIAVTFLFTRKVIRLISEKARELSSFTGKTSTLEISASENVKLTSSSNGTKLTSLPVRGNPVSNV